MRICLVSRELYPYQGGGIAPIVAAAARQLSEVAEVVVVTSGIAAAEHRELLAAGDPRVPAGVEVLFVAEPGDAYGGALSYMHAYSARVHDVLRARYGDRGPDVLEFCDYLGEGLVTMQAKQTHARWLDDTLVCVRLHTTSEFCAVLDGHLPDTFDTEALLEGERFCLRHADRVLWSGGDTYATYQRYYGADAIAPGVELPDAFLDEVGVVPDRSGAPGDDEPLKLLFLGRMERRKGIHDLLRGLLDLDRDDWRLTLVGGDTDTGPLGTSMHDQLRLTAADDPRVVFAAPVPRAEVGRLIADHHVVVVPSRWECWPNVAREALQHNRPVFGTPVGGLCALAVPGRSGILAPGTGPRALRAGAEALLEARRELADMIIAGGPRARFEELCDPDALRERYVDLAAAAPGVRPPARVPVSAPLVTVVVPYFEMDALVEETLDAVAAQDYPEIEVVVVNDGSLRRRDAEVLGRVAERPGVRVVTQVNAGLGAARNFGVSLAKGRYVLPLDSDDLIAPDLVRRLVEVMEAEPSMAYCGTWVQYIDEDGIPFGGDIDGYLPFGNWSTLMRRNNVGGVCTCLFRRALFDAGFAYDDELTSYEDWLLMRELHDAGHFGAILPERLFLYRVRRGSMMRQVGAPRLARLEGELRARRLERDMGWTAGSSSRTSGDGRIAEQTLPAPSILPDADEALLIANAQLAGAAGSRRGAGAAHALAAAATETGS
ncbi:MAG: glycosyl transferase group 1 [Solirubrobacterales bacterium]|nr:glycosyl transferase group 1 [Solirubrobacterales bacterium]